MSRPAPGTATRQDVLGASGAWQQVAAEGGTAVLSRGRQLADHLGPLLRYQLAADGTVVAGLSGQPLRGRLGVELLNVAWRTTADGMAGQGVPSQADLAEAAELIRGRATDEGRRRTEAEAAAAAIRQASAHADEAAHAAATAARREALQNELAALDEPDPTGTPWRPWRRGSTDPTSTP